MCQIKTNIMKRLLQIPLIYCQCAPEIINFEIGWDLTCANRGQSDQKESHDVYF